jgi:hypothetical protein
MIPKKREKRTIKSRACVPLRIRISQGRSMAITVQDRAIDLQQGTGEFARMHQRPLPQVRVLTLEDLLINHYILDNTGLILYIFSSAG